MNNSKVCILIIAVLFGLVMPQTNMSKQLSPDNISQREVTCEEALKNVSRVKIGMKDSEILDLLGTPTAIKEDNWGYNFLACSPPPKAGEQLIIGVGIIFKEKVVKEIGWAIVCATGMNVSTPKKRKIKD